MRLDTAEGARYAEPEHARIDQRVDEIARHAALGLGGVGRGTDARDERADGVMLVARAGAPARLTALADSRVMIIGGEPVGPRHIWWNFVSSSKERIERAKRDWVEGRIGKISGDDELIPLPER